MRKRWNVMIVPNSPGENIFSFDFSARSLWVSAVVAATLLLLVVTGVLYAGHNWKKEKLLQVSRLQAELDKRDEEFTRLDREFSIIEELEDKLRTIAGLKPRERSTVEAPAGGQGGPGQEMPAGEASAALGVNAPLNPVDHGSAEELITDSISLKDSFAEVMDVFERESSRLSSIPSINPVASQEAWVSSGFGYRKDPINGTRRFHDGCDIVAPRATPVIAPADGIVTFAGWRDGLGRMIKIEHGYGYATAYGHNNRLFVKKGDLVKRGDLIAHVGSSGRSTGPHLHYEVRLGGKLVNPYKYLVQ
ncbi:MAG: M23 family metallopeptidase [Candidatus Abyssubacteria bacterium]|nr:M23 family metallopeptidase [Candidatus Abyssubacteria bacterium]